MKKLLVVMLMGGIALGAMTYAGSVTLNLYNCAGYESFYAAEVIPAFEKAFPNIKINYVRTSWPELFSKFKVLEEVGKLEPGKNDEVHLVILGGAVIGNFLPKYAVKLLPNHEEKLPNVEELIGIAKEYVQAWEGKAIVCHVDYYPLLLRNPDRVPEPFVNVEQLKEWIKANPGRFMYGLSLIHI